MIVVHTHTHFHRTGTSCAWSCQSQQLDCAVLPALWNITPHFCLPKLIWQKRFSQHRYVQECNKNPGFVPWYNVFFITQTHLTAPRGCRLHTPWGASVENHQFHWARCRGEGVQRQGWLAAAPGVFVKGQGRPERTNSYVNTGKIGKTNSRC